MSAQTDSAMGADAIAGDDLTHTTIVRQKPLMDMRQILLMNFGFFGIQYSFGMQQTAINPIFQFIGANAHDLPLLNMAGPVTGLLIQPIIGAMSDRTWSPRWGRRKPFFLVGAIGCSVCLFLFPFVSALWMAVLLLWLLDASNNTAMEPYRAFIADKLPPSQLGKGFLAQSFFTGFGITLANLSLFVFQNLIDGATEAELKALREKKGSLFGFLREIWDAIVEMPVELRKLGLVYLFQWYAMMCYWQYVTLSMAKSVWGTTDAHSEGFKEAVGWTGLINGWYNIVTFLIAFSLVAFARRRGAKFVHMACLLLASAGLLIFPHLTNKYLLFIPIIGLGIAWASIMGVPYIMAVRMIPSTRYGVYMGIINMMIVIPMLIHSVTFGWVYTNVLGENPNNAITFAALGLAAAAIAMLWIREPPIVRDVDDVMAMPGGGH